MAWTAKLTKAAKVSGGINVAIEYTNGVDTVTKTYRFDHLNTKRLKRLARNEVANLESWGSETINVAVGADIDLTPPTPPAEPVPTQAQLDRDAWFKDWQQLSALLLLVDAELILPTDSRISPLKTSLSAGLKPAYLKNIE